MTWGFKAKGPIARTGIALAMLMASASLAGCSSGDTENGTLSAEQGKTDHVNGALLATIEDGTDHRVEFYDFGYGIRGCREIHLEKDASWFAGLQIDGKSLSELYQILRPQAVVPQAIRDADARAVVDLARIAAADPKLPISRVVSAPPNVSPPVELPAGEASKIASLGAEANISQISSAQVVCGPDWNHDNWAAQWFKTGFYNNNGAFRCTNGFTETPQFGTNYSSQQLRAVAGVNYMYHQFEGDGTNSGASLGKWVRGTQSQEMWNVVIPPRQVQSWALSGGNSTYSYILFGFSPCNHLGYSLVDCSSFG